VLADLADLGVDRLELRRASAHELLCELARGVVLGPAYSSKNELIDCSTSLAGTPAVSI
jgi:hypothetical protein